MMITDMTSGPSIDPWQPSPPPPMMPQQIPLNGGALQRYSSGSPTRNIAQSRIDSPQFSSE
jgi:hypothetical protein